MKTNPFVTARRNKRIKTIGDAITALVDAFSGEDSGDVMGAYILERAAEEAKTRLPARQAEWDAIMARIQGILKPAEPELRCSECGNTMSKDECGDELPEERVCDACAELEEEVFGPEHPRDKDGKWTDKA